MAETAVHGAEQDRTHPRPLPSRPPRCPDYREATSVDDLLPYLDAVAKRQFSHGLWAAWGLKPGERVLLRVDNWHDPMCVEAAIKILERFGCTYELLMEERGPIRSWHAEDEIEAMVGIIKENSAWLVEWDKMETEGKYDKLLWGFGGPILSERRIKVARFPFITPEMVMSAAHTIPAEILRAIDEWTWQRMREARRVHIDDPEGTDVSYTNHAEYWDRDRLFYNKDQMKVWYPQNVGYGRTYLPGHVWGKPDFLLGPEFEDGNGVIGGTMNHFGPYPHMRVHIRDSKVVEIEGGGLFGDGLRRINEETSEIQYPSMPGKGLLWWWEASIGTNPKIHRPRKDFLKGHVACIYERMRSGIVHIGFGTVVSSFPEEQAVRLGHKYMGHWHTHLNYATMTTTTDGGGSMTIIEDGRLKALDDPDVRAVASRFGDPDRLLDEDWIPAVPGINVEGNYWRDYAHDPEDWTLTELNICRKWHHLYMKMIMPSGQSYEGHHHGH